MHGFSQCSARVWGVLNPSVLATLWRHVAGFGSFVRENSSNVIEAVNGGHLPGAIGTNEHHSVSIAEH